MIATQASAAFLLDLLKAHRTFDFEKIEPANASRTLGDFHTAPGRAIVGLGYGNFDTAIERMMESQIFVDIARGNLAGAYRADRRRRPGLAIAPHENTFKSFGL